MKNRIFPIVLALFGVGISAQEFKMPDGSTQVVEWFGTGEHEVDPQFGVSLRGLWNVSVGIGELETAIGQQFIYNGFGSNFGGGGALLFDLTPIHGFELGFNATRIDLEGYLEYRGYNVSDIAVTWTKLIIPLYYKFTYVSRYIVDETSKELVARSRFLLGPVSAFNLDGELNQDGTKSDIEPFNRVDFGFSIGVELELALGPGMFMFALHEYFFFVPPKYHLTSFTSEADYDKVFTKDTIDAIHMAFYLGYAFYF